MDAQAGNVRVEGCALPVGAAQIAVIVHGKYARRVGSGNVRLGIVAQEPGLLRRKARLFQRQLEQSRVGLAQHVVRAGKHRIEAVVRIEPFNPMSQRGSREAHVADDPGADAVGPQPREQLLHARGGRAGCGGVPVDLFQLVHRQRKAQVEGLEQPPPALPVGNLHTDGVGLAAQLVEGLLEGGKQKIAVDVRGRIGVSQNGVEAVPGAVVVLVGQGLAVVKEHEAGRLQHGGSSECMYRESIARRSAKIKTELVDRGSTHPYNKAISTIGEVLT